MSETADAPRPDPFEEEQNKWKESLRLTTSAMPMSKGVARQSGVPLAVCASPFNGEHAEIDVPLPRCERCGAYMNPHAGLRNGGGQWSCNLCHKSWMEPSPEWSRMAFTTKRPELRSASIDAPQPSLGGAKGADPSGRDPPGCIVLVVEATNVSRATGALAVASDAAGEILRTLPTVGRAGVAAFDGNGVHYFRPGGWVDTMPDLSGPFAPPHEAALSGDVESIAGLAYGMPEQAGAAALRTERAGVGAMAALASAVRLAGEAGGGRVVCFASGGDAPGWEEGLAEEAVDGRVRVDAFALAEEGMDVGWMGVVARRTGGLMRWHSPFVAAMDGKAVLGQANEMAQAAVGEDALVTLRCSEGLEAWEYGEGVKADRGGPVMRVPVAGRDWERVIRVQHTGDVIQEAVYFQLAASYYDPRREERRVRVHTARVEVTRRPCDTLLSAHERVILAECAKEAAAKMEPQKGGEDPKTVLERRCVEMLVAYRKHCATGQSQGLLLLPDSLRLLPLHSLGVRKLPCFRGGDHIADVSKWLHRVKSGSPESIAAAAYPRLFNLHHADPSLLQGEANGDLRQALPPALWASAGKLERPSAFLLEDGFQTTLWLGPGMAAEDLEALFGTPYESEMDPYSSWPLTTSSPLSVCFHGIYANVCAQRGEPLPLRIARRGEHEERQFFLRLVEDQSAAGYSYIEHLRHLHGRVKRLVESGSG